MCFMIMLWAGEAGSNPVQAKKKKKQFEIIIQAVRLKNNISILFNLI